VVSHIELYTGHPRFSLLIILHRPAGVVGSGQCIIRPTLPMISLLRASSQRPLARPSGYTVLRWLFRKVATALHHSQSFHASSSVLPLPCFDFGPKAARKYGPARSGVTVDSKLTFNEHTLLLDTQRGGPRRLVSPRCERHTAPSKVGQR